MVRSLLRSLLVFEGRDSLEVFGQESGEKVVDSPSKVTLCFPQRLYLIYEKIAKDARQYATGLGETFKHQNFQRRETLKVIEVSEGIENICLPREQ